jgi:hypothetical protein
MTQPPANSDALLARLKSIRRIAAFDTNAYRGLVHNRSPATAKDRSARLARSDSMQSTIALAIPWVIVELIAHLRSRQDPAFEQCLSAICALWTHCKMETDDGETLGILSDSETQLGQSLYLTVADSSSKTNQLLTGMVQEIAGNPTTDGLASLRDEIEQCGKIADKFELDFVRSMRRVLADYDPSVAEQRREYGQMLSSPKARLIGARIAVLRARAVLGISDPDPDLDDRVLAVANQFPVATGLQAFKLRQMAIDGLDIMAHRNSAWDIDICYYIGQTIAGVPVQLVTADRDIVDRARAAGQGALVQNLHSYLTAAGMV